MRIFEHKYPKGQGIFLQDLNSSCKIAHALH